MATIGRSHEFRLRERLELVAHHFSEWLKPRA